jgi:cyclase
MIRPRIIPCLLLSDGGLVKTVNFKNPKYVGDPLNVVKILNEKEVDELVLLDINCSTRKKEIDFKLIEKIASECRMPLCYGGGVTKTSDFQALINIGVEKVAISTSIFDSRDILAKASGLVGSQSVVVVLDVKRENGQYILYLSNGIKRTSYEVLDFLKTIDQSQIGEIVINSIDRDGTMAGYDFDLLEYVYSHVRVPLTFLGGAADSVNIRQLFLKYGNVGAGVGSLFVFKGKFKAVLVNYPSGNEKFEIIK